MNDDITPEEAAEVERLEKEVTDLSILAKSVMTSHVENNIADDGEKVFLISMASLNIIAAAVHAVAEHGEARTRQAMMDGLNTVLGPEIDKLVTALNRK